ncbi:MAG: hypothetical protein RMJ00_07370 [Nitrososphaerota archaeon]|nr:CooT family nickel-binding protein [Candidatus Bathyarchaeota archaeon]MCX8162350.1 CooT family nickel-binding protein [Candidatus Bathyarchaeota archaeon]MDW8062498.1 hypothetical protein [Nitrososphaerota archaeon]
MCLLKAYIEDRDERKLVAKDVAFVTINGGTIDLKDVRSRSLAYIEKFTSVEIDALGSCLVVKRI